MIFHYFGQFELVNLKWTSMVKAAILRVHNPEVVGSNPTPAAKRLSRQDDFHSRPVFLLPPSLHMSLLKYFELWYYRSQYVEKSVQRSVS